MRGEAARRAGEGWSGLKIGLFGGSFDPVHAGHIALAAAARDELGLDKVIFIPAKRPPHKLNKQLSPAPARFEMLKAALKPHKKFSVSRYELDRKPVTYTYQTAAHFKKLYPGAELFFVIGADSLAELATWKKIGRLVREVRFAAGRRPGVKPRGRFLRSVKLLKKKLPGVSSSLVRELAAAGKPLKGLVPASVEKIIRKTGVYGKDLTEEIITYLKKHLDSARFKHSVGTTRIVRDLALKNGVPERKAVIAGLLHDAGKCYSGKEMIRYALRRRLKVPYMKDVIKHNPSLLHGYISADIARRKFGVADRDMLLAMAQHTVGGERMSKLSKIIYIADSVSYDRRYPGVERLRKLAYADLDGAVKAAMANKLYYVIKKRKWIHPGAVKAWNSMIEPQAK